jgi:hypothetical protein
MSRPTGPRRELVRHHSAAVRAAMRASDSYGLLRAFLVVDYLLISLVTSQRWNVLIVGLPISLTLVLALRTSHAQPSLQRLGAMSLPLVFLIGVVQAITDSDTTRGFLFLLLAVPFVIAPIAVVRRILNHKRVGRETLLGAVCVYLMLAMAFGVLYIGMGHVETNPPFFAQRGRHDASDYVYFSFVTITTVGYGDLSPLSKEARTVVVMEAVLGQIFLVTLVARLVSMFGQDLRPVESGPANDDPDGA